MKTILRSTAALALLGAATAAGTYPTSEVACDLFEGEFICNLHEDKAACEADSNCAFDEESEMCEPTEEYMMPMQYSLMNATAAL